VRDRAFLCDWWAFKLHADSGSSDVSTRMLDGLSGRELSEVTETLYPSEAVLARLVLADRAKEWPAKAVVLERDGLPKLDPLMGGRFWPAVKNWFMSRHGLSLNSNAGATIPANARIRLVPFAPDGKADFDGEKAEAARRQRRNRRTRRPRLAPR
jgi:hypothetical protein